MAEVKQLAEPVTGPEGLTSVRSRSGALAITCTAAGLPVRMRISAAAMRRSPDALAQEILALCRLAGAAAGVSNRAQLVGDGVDEETLGLLGLPSRAELVAAEAAADACAARGRR